MGVSPWVKGQIRLQMFGQSVEESAEENAMSVVEETAMSAFTMEQTGAFEETGIQFQLPGLNNMSAVMSDGTGTSVPWADAFAPVATTCRPFGTNVLSENPRTPEPTCTGRNSKSASFAEQKTRKKKTKAAPPRTCEFRRYGSIGQAGLEPATKGL